MALFAVTEQGLQSVAPTSFGAERILERRDLQRFLRDQIAVVCPNAIVIAEEFSDWDASDRRIDLLAIDRDANLVVIELKRTETGGHMELQAARYAAMVSTMTFQQAVDVYRRYLEAIGQQGVDPQEQLLRFLEWPEPDEDNFNSDVRIILVSAEFSKELTSTVLWLNDHGLDIRCVRLLPYRHETRVLIDVQQIVPLPEAADYQIRVREKSEQRRVARQSSPDYRRFHLCVDGEPETQPLYKRGLIYQVVKAILGAGQTTPDDLASIVPDSRRWWVYTEGVLDPGSFIEAVSRQRSSEHRSFDHRRFFVAEGELFHVGNRTYALTNQWGTNTLPAVDQLAAAFPQLRITYRADS